MSIKKYTEKELEFTFPDSVVWDELDQQGIKIPQGMTLIDLVIERERDVLLVEIKDPSHSLAPEKERRKYFKRLMDNSVIREELTPKARDSYTFLHLMTRDTKPFVYVVLLGLDAFDSNEQLILLANFKDRLIGNIRNEAVSPWKRTHIKDCVVLNIGGWNRTFPNWPVRRL